jgi:ribosomal protein S18 acetylase RimI-like enzyme
MEVILVKNSKGLILSFIVLIAAVGLLYLYSGYARSNSIYTISTSSRIANEVDRKNIFIALLIGGLVGSLTYFKTFIDRRRIERKFKIRGEYISRFSHKFEDEEIIKSSSLVLNQKGYRVFGETYAINGDRRLILEGNISEDGLICGIYYDEDSTTEGIVNFFLKLDKKHKMEGLWSSFDSGNNKINSGKCSIRKISRNIKIQNYEPKHRHQILELSNKQLGKNYLTKENITKTHSDPNNYLALAIDENGVLAGFCIGYIVDSTKIEQEFKINPEDTPEIIKHTNKIAVLKTIAVSEKYQGIGVGTDLVKDCINYFKSKDLSAICSIGWKSKNGTNVERVLVRAGFDKLREIPKFWNIDSVEKKYNCPVCGNPCNCSAVIFFTTL